MVASGKVTRPELIIPFILSFYSGWCQASHHSQVPVGADTGGLRDRQDWGWRGHQSYDQMLNQYRQSCLISFCHNKHFTYTQQINTQQADIWQEDRETYLPARGEKVSCCFCNWIALIVNHFAVFMFCLTALQNINIISCYHHNSHWQCAVSNPQFLLGFNVDSSQILNIEYWQRCLCVRHCQEFLFVWKLAGLFHLTTGPLHQTSAEVVCDPSVWPGRSSHLVNHNLMSDEGSLGETENQHH